MHLLVSLQHVTFFNRPEIRVGAKIAVPLSERAVDLGNKCTRAVVDQSDPEADRVEVEPQETGLRQKNQTRGLDRKTARL